MHARLYLRKEHFVNLSLEAKEDLMMDGYMDANEIDAAQPSDVLEFIGDDRLRGEFFAECELIAKKMPFDRWTDTGGYHGYKSYTRYYRPARDGQPAIDENHNDEDLLISPKDLESIIAELPCCPAKEKLANLIDQASLPHIPLLCDL